MQQIVLLQLAPNDGGRPEHCGSFDLPDLALPIVTKYRTSALRRLRKLQRSIGWTEVSCRYFGARFVVQLTDLVGFEIATGRFEYHNLKRMLRECRARRPDIFIDVGANIGLYSCVLGRAGVVGVVSAFEPDPLLHRELVANTERNGVAADNVLAAAGFSTGSVRFTRAGHDNRGLGRVSADGEEVRAIALDDHVPLRGKVVALKVDV